MSSSAPPSRNPGKRAWWIVIALASAAILVVVAISTRGFGLAETSEPPSKASVARQHCEPEVANRLASPATANLSQIETASAELDPDSKDLFSLLENPLKGVDHTRITVWNVTGVVQVQTESGAMLHDPFSCRAYFIDDDLAHTLVLFDREH